MNKCTKLEAVVHPPKVQRLKRFMMMKREISRLLLANTGKSSGKRDKIIK